MERDGINVHKLAKKYEAKIKPSLSLIEQAWSIEDLFMTFAEIFLPGHGGLSPAGKIVPLG